jgi:apolipoprotein D and lipocalin family protein
MNSVIVQALRMSTIKSFFLTLLAILTAGCATPPKGLKPIEKFQLPRYLGTWYEIARLDHSFERGLDNITAAYYLKSDGSVSVLNRGREVKTGQYKTARGTAVFIGKPDVAALKVTFFKPFWGAYYVIALDKQDYAWAMVTSSSRKYLWILSRTPVLDPLVLNELLAQAKDWQFETDKLIFPLQDEKKETEK